MGVKRSPAAFAHAGQKFGHPGDSRGDALLSPTFQMGRGATDRSPENRAVEVERRAHSKRSHQ